MSEMMGADKGLAETTKAVKGVESTIADGDRSVSAKLSMIGRVLSIESPAEKAARQQSQEQASAAAANFQRLIQLQAQGNATDEQVLAAQEQMEQTASEAAEAAEKEELIKLRQEAEAAAKKEGPMKKLMRCFDVFDKELYAEYVCPNGNVFCRFSFVF